MRQPSIHALRTWYEHERRVLEIICQALTELRQAQSLTENEPALNRKLYRCLCRVNNRLYRRGQGRGLPCSPFWEAQNQPLVDDQTRAARENKRPDFQWGFVNLQEPDDDRASMIYTIECKRLGQSASGRILNVLYLEEGVVRFVTEEHGYGKATRSGAMVGYVQSMPFVQILAEVNAAANERSLPPIALTDDAWSENGVTRLSHQLFRPTSLLSPFDLRHIWVDLRQAGGPFLAQRRMH